MNDLMRSLLDLTRIDRKLVRCRKRVLAGPTEVAQRRERVKEAERALETRRAAVRDQALDSDRHALEAHTAAAEVNQVQQRLRVVKNNTEYSHLNERLRDLRAVIDREETAVLGGMEAMDRFRAQEKECADALDRERAGLAALEADVAAEAGRIALEQRDLKAKREVQLRRIGELDPSGAAAASYDAAVKRTRGDAMGLMADNVCQACCRTQNPNVLNAILMGSDATAMTCPGCGRILYLDDKPDRDDEG